MRVDHKRSPIVNLSPSPRSYKVINVEGHILGEIVLNLQAIIEVVRRRGSVTYVIIWNIRLNSVLISRGGKTGQPDTFVANKKWVGLGWPVK